MKEMTADIDNLLKELLSRQKRILGEKMVGLYLYGSLVWGDFDYEISDLDLLAALTSDLNDEESEKLKQMHEELASTFPFWKDRIEVQYFSLEGLKTFKTKATKMGAISPGEPFNIKEAGKEWLTNWYFVQMYGVILYGPDPQTFIAPVSDKEFIQAVKDHALAWKDYVKNTKHSRKYQAYAILTMCRALYTCRHGEQVSKRQAANWAKKELPEWSQLIQNALD